MSARKKPVPEVPFEKALARLEEIVARLEGGDLTLEESLSAFVEGRGLVEQCLERLEAAEATVKALEEGPDGFRLAPAGMGEDGSGSRGTPEQDRTIRSRGGSNDEDDEEAQDTGLF